MPIRQNRSSKFSNTRPLKSRGYTKKPGSTLTISTPNFSGNVQRYTGAS